MLYRVVIDHGLTTQTVMMRADSGGDAIDRAIIQLEQDGIKYSSIKRASAKEEKE